MGAGVGWDGGASCSTTAAAELHLQCKASPATHLPPTPTSYESMQVDYFKFSRVLELSRVSS